MAWTALCIGFTLYVCRGQEKAIHGRAQKVMAWDSYNLGRIRVRRAREPAIAWLESFYF